MLEKVREIFDDGISDVIQSRYVDNSLESVKEEPLFVPKVQTTRLTEHYLPATATGEQDFECPPTNKLSYDKTIIGIADAGNLQFFFIYSD